MGEARRKREKRDDKNDSKKLERGLEGTFPASDPIQEEQPGGGITGTEPPPAGQKTGK
jgi:hypothetical protein